MSHSSRRPDVLLLYPLLKGSCASGTSLQRDCRLKVDTHLVLFLKLVSSFQACFSITRLPMVRKGSSPKPRCPYFSWYVLRTGCPALCATADEARTAGGAIYESAWYAQSRATVSANANGPHEEGEPLHLEGDVQEEPELSVVSQTHYRTTPRHHDSWPGMQRKSGPSMENV